MGHIREKKLSNGETAYMLVVDCGTHRDGRRKQKTKTLRHVTKREAKKELIKFENEIAEGEYTDRSNVTLKEYMTDWLKIYKKPFLSPTTYHAYVNKFEVHICSEVYGIGHYQLQKLKPMHIQVFINEMMNCSCVTGKPLSPKTVKDVYKILHAALRNAVQEGIIKDDPANFVKLPKNAKKKKEVFTYEQVQKLCHELRERESDLEIPVHLAISLGLRRGEVLGLRFGDIDFEKGILHIIHNRIEFNGIVAEKEPKTSNSIRTLSIPSGLLDMLKKQQKSMKKSRFKEGASYNEGDYVCYHPRTGMPWEPNNLGQKYTRLVRELGLPPVSFHGLRHCYASICIDQGMSIVDVQNMLGHASASFTYDTYVHSMEDNSYKSADIMDSVLYNEDREKSAV